MKSKHLFKISLILQFGLFASGFAVAEELNFYCKGVTKGRTIADSPAELNMIFKTSPPDIVLPVYINGNISFNKKKEKEMRGGCEMTETTIN